MKEINIYFSKENNAMKKLIFKTLPAVILLVGAFIVLGGCKEKEQIKLKGTSWKLKGIYNANTKEFKVFAPEKCNDCYSFTFDTDTTAKELLLVLCRKLQARQLQASTAPNRLVLF